MTLSFSLLLGSCSSEEIAPSESRQNEKTTEQGTSNVGSITFDYNKHMDYIANALNGKTLGYSLRLDAEGILVGKCSGLAINLPNPNPVPGQLIPGVFNFSNRMETMQLSSTITAATLLKVIEGKAGAVTVDSPILPYLPANWKTGPNVKLLTFRHLLSNNSGLSPQLLGVGEPETDSYENLRKLIANGIPAAYIQDRNGKPVIVDTRKLSVNYALMRILIPYLQNGASVYKQNEAKGTNAEATSSAYVALVNKLVLIKSLEWNNDMKPLDVVPTGNSPYTRYYQFGNLNNSWEQDNLGRLYCGANRWFLSNDEYMVFLRWLWKGTILSPASLEVMKSGQMGMTFTYGTYGKYYYQKGYAVKDGAGLATIWMVYPNGVRAILFINTVGGLPNDSAGTPNLQDILQKAYDNAWVETPVVQ